MEKKAIVLGGTGFIGQHLVERLWREGYYVRVVDRKAPEYPINDRHMDFTLYDLSCNRPLPLWWFYDVDEVYQLAADMGGIGFISDHDNDLRFLQDNVQININVLSALRDNTRVKVFYASSACVYGSMDTCRETDAYPAACDHEYGWEKLYSERLYMAYARVKGMQVRIGRFHNIYGPYHEYKGGREKAPAAICRKVAMAKDGENIEIWGSGKQTRTFAYIDDCVEGVRRVMNANYALPINIGSDFVVSINDLVDTVINISGKSLHKVHVAGEVGVNDRSSHNGLVESVLGWAPSTPLIEGLEKTYAWVKEQVDGTRTSVERKS